MKALRGRTKKRTPPLKVDFWNPSLYLDAEKSNFKVELPNRIEKYGNIIKLDLNRSP